MATLAPQMQSRLSFDPAPNLSKPVTTAPLPRNTWRLNPPRKTANTPEIVWSKGLSKASSPHCPLLLQVWSTHEFQVTEALTGFVRWRKFLPGRVAPQEILEVPVDRVCVFGESTWFLYDLSGGFPYKRGALPEGASPPARNARANTADYVFLGKHLYRWDPLTESLEASLSPPRPPPGSHVQGFHDTFTWLHHVPGAPDDGDYPVTTFFSQLPLHGNVRGEVSPMTIDSHALEGSLELDDTENTGMSSTIVPQVPRLNTRPVIARCCLNETSVITLRAWAPVPFLTQHVLYVQVVPVNDPVTPPKPTDHEADTSMALEEPQDHNNNSKIPRISLQLLDVHRGKHFSHWAQGLNDVMAQYGDTMKDIQIVRCVSFRRTLLLVTARNVYIAQHALKSRSEPLTWLHVSRSQQPTASDLQPTVPFRIADVLVLEQYLLVMSSKGRAYVWCLSDTHDFLWGSCLERHPETLPRKRDIDLDAAKHSGSVGIVAHGKTGLNKRQRITSHPM